MGDGAGGSQESLPRWARTRVASALGIDYPLVQGPLGGLASQRLAAAVSNFGGLGSFGAHGLEPAAIGDVIAEIRLLTHKPFAMNLWVSMEDEGAFASDALAFTNALAPVAEYFDELGVAMPTYAAYTPTRFEDQVRVLLDERVPVFSFLFGIPHRDVLDECRRLSIVTVGTATTVDEAIMLEQAGVDVVVASGFEAGGHRGSFLRAHEASLMGTFSLVPQVVDAVRVPVIAAGGIADARGVVAAFALGAEGVQMGTFFLGCEESGASALHRDIVLGGRAQHTVLTKGFTGRVARGVVNTVTDAFNEPGVPVLPYPLQRGMMRVLNGAAVQAGRDDLAQLWAGQSAGLVRGTDATTMMRELVSGVSAQVG